MSILPEEQRVRAVLRELSTRAESVELREDCQRLHKLLDDPIFRRISQKSLDREAAAAKVKECVSTTGLLVDRLRSAVEKELLADLKDNQRVHFVELNLDELRPSFLDSGEDSLLIVGPKDIKSRTSGRLRIGDRIRAVVLVESNASQPSTRPTTPADGRRKDSTKARATVPQLIRHPTVEQLPDGGRIALASVRESAAMVLSGDWTQVEVIRLSTEGGASLGFGIVGGASTGVVVKTILPGSPADKDTRLRPGDHILQIGNVSTHGMSSQQVASILRQQESLVEMIVGRPINYADRPPDTAECWTMSTRAALNSQTLEEFVQRAARASPPSTSTTKTPEDTILERIDETEHLQNDEETEEKQETRSQGSKKSESRRASAAEKASQNGHQPATPSTSKGSKESTDEQRRTSHDRRISLQSGTSVPEVPCNGGPRTPTTSRISLRTLQEMALTVFLKENWIDKPYETVYVTLERDPALGLGITVAGYVHKKAKSNTSKEPDFEEIGGVFVKSLVPRSAASGSGKILVHDLIVEVNDISLEGFSHADSVRTLVKSGPLVRLKLIRFPSDSAQAQCLRMLHEQETDTQVIDVQSSNPDLVAEWKRKISEDVDIISAVLKPDRKDSGDGGLGISLEGTVDVLNGLQLCPHHYIEGLRADGPAAKSGQLQAGDELLQVNHSPLYGESHVTVRQALTRAVNSGAPVTLIVARRTQHVNLFQPNSMQASLPAAYPLLAYGHDRVVKAKSEINLKDVGTEGLLRLAAKRLRSRSLEPIEQLAIWNCVPLVVHLDKDVRGLGFSVVDYQDPSHPGETVIVVQSLVPGGIAQADGRIVPGDRLLFVNNHDLSNSSLERAVAVLKSAPQGRVRLGIAKPIPVDQCAASSHSPLFSRSERLLARGSSPRGRRRKASTGVTSSQETVWIGGPDEYRRKNPQAYYSTSRSPSCSLRSLDGSESMASWSPCSTRSLSPAGSPLPLRGSWSYDVVYLPTHLERSIKLQKGALPLGVVLDADKDKGVNGCVIKSICGKKAVALDGRLQQGDHLVKINTESLRNVTNSQARAIMKRTNLIGTQCNITYITASDAKTWKERFGREPPSSPVINRLSPKIFPKFYRSPYLSRKGSFRDTDEEPEPMSEASDAGISELHSEGISTMEAIPSTSKEPKERLHRQETVGREATRLVDGLHIDDMVNELIQEALRDALIELVVAHKTPDWNISQPSTSRHGKEITPPPSRSSSQKTPSPAPKTPKVQSPTESIKSRQESLIRRDSEPASLKPIYPEEGAEVPTTSAPPTREEVKDEEIEAALRLNHSHLEQEQPSTSSATEEEAGQPATMKRLSCRTGSSGSETIQNQAKQLTRSKFWGEARTVVLHREPNKSFGISIVGGRVEVSQKGGLPGTGNTVSGIFIKSVLPNSPAGQSGGMNMGDRVISVNDIDLREATHEQAVAAIKNATNPVKFVLQSLHSFTPPQNMINSSSNSTVGSIRVEPFKHDEEPDDPVTTTTAVIEERPQEAKAVTTPEPPSPPPEEPKEPSPIKELPIKQLSKEESREDEETPKAEKKNSVSFMAEGSKRSSVREKSPRNSIKSQESQKRKASMKQKDSINTEDTVRKASYASGPLIVSDVSSSENHDEEPPTTSGIDATSAALAVDEYGDPPSRFGYTKGKLQARYGHIDGEVLLVDCDSVPEAGLGISLAGNKDREKLNIFVINVKVACPLAIKRGDEILEVNGKVLRGLSHVVASNIIRDCCNGPLEMVICRRDGAMADCAVQSDPKASTSSSTSTPAGDEAFYKAVASPGLVEQEHPSDGSMPPTNDSDTALQTIEAVRKKSFSLERTVPIEVGKETLIEIDKEGKGLGLSIVGGSDTVLGAVVIHEVYPDGAAAHDGRLKPGDQVLEVNKTNLRGMTHDQAISTLRRTPPKVRLLIYRDVNLQLSLLDPTQIYNMFEVELTKKPGRGLGLSIVGRKNEPGVYVSEVVKGGTAEADGRLMTGDQILNVNGQDVSASMQEDVAAMLKTCVGRVNLKIGRWKLNETTTRVHAAAEAASNLTASMTTPRPTLHSPAEASTSVERQVPSPAPPMPRPTITHTNAEGAPEDPQDLSPVQEEASTGTESKSNHEEDRGTLAYNIHHDLKEEGSDTLMVELRKVPDQQLGMGIGKRTRGILVTSLQPGSAAAEKLKVGDRILAVNALPVTDQLSAVTFVKASGERLFLQIARPRVNPS